MFLTLTDYIDMFALFLHAVLTTECIGFVFLRLSEPWTNVQMITMQNHSDRITFQ